MNRTRHLAAGLALLCAWPASGQGTPDPRETTPFVIGYRCDAGTAVAIAYPAFRDAHRVPIRLSFQGRRYPMHLVRSASGIRYVTADRRLEWLTRGSDEGSLAVPGVSPPIATCKAF